MTYYLGVDAGGTRTRARLVDPDGTVIGIGEAGPANTRAGIDAVEGALNAATGAAIVQAGLNPAQVATIRAGMGIAGITRTGMKAQIAALPFPFAGLALSSDSMIANLGAHGGGDGDPAQAPGVKVRHDGLFMKTVTVGNFTLADLQWHHWPSLASVARSAVTALVAKREGGELEAVAAKLAARAEFVFTECRCIGFVLQIDIGFFDAERAQGFGHHALQWNLAPTQVGRQVHDASDIVDSPRQRNTNACQQELPIRQLCAK